MADRERIFEAEIRRREGRLTMDELGCSAQHLQKFTRAARLAVFEKSNDKATCLPRHRIKICPLLHHERTLRHGLVAMDDMTVAVALIEIFAIPHP